MKMAVGNHRVPNAPVGNGVCNVVPIKIDMPNDVVNVFDSLNSTPSRTPQTLTLVPGWFYTSFYE